MTQHGRFRLADAGRLLGAWLTASLALVVTSWLVPGLSATTPAVYLVVTAVAALLGLVLRPLVSELSARIGWVAVLPVALVGQAVVMYAAIAVTPGIEAGFWTAVGASWVAALVSTGFAWFTTAGTDDGLVASLSRRGRKVATVPDPDVPGVVFVQMDGVPFPVLRWAVQAGSVPTIRRWLGSGDYELREWTPQMPCTTPASQLGILHGTVDRIPAFRWYDRELGRVLVANRPADAAIIEQRVGELPGLLVDDGVSISNLFSGGAMRTPMTMSRVAATRGSLETRRAVAWYLTTPNGFSRSVSRTVAEVVRERWQSRRQRRRDLDPRVHRGWTFALLRAATNGLLRDLNTALVAEEMRRGTRSIYVDYVDYDEIAHHAGMFRPESLGALDGLDRVLGALEKLAVRGARPYRIVVLSDHGQSQGKSFHDRYGEDLPGLVARLTAEGVASYDQAVEGWGRAESLVADVGGGSGQMSKVARRVGDRVERELDADTSAASAESVVVLGSGNLGLVYVPGPERLSLDELGARWPQLVPGLAGHPGVGFVAGLDASGTPWVLGPDGRRDLASGAVEGRDPLEPYGDHAGRVLLRAMTMREAPDLYVNSVVDPYTLDVAAFESLVGAHGGLGGWQDRAVLLAPRDLMPPQGEPIEGADALHRVLVRMLERCGHRAAGPAVQPAARDGAV